MAVDSGADQEDDRVAELLGNPDGATITKLTFESGKKNGGKFGC
ncbi:hypothetical protein [Peribacillus aracenensis]|nr:hypothetical protein [Peribacillus sp. BBB004]